MQHQQFGWNTESTRNLSLPPKHFESAACVTMSLTSNKSKNNFQRLYTSTCWFRWRILCASRQQCSNECLFLGACKQELRPLCLDDRVMCVSSTTDHSSIIPPPPNCWMKLLNLLIRHHLWNSCCLHHGGDAVELKLKVFLGRLPNLDLLSKDPELDLNKPSSAHSLCKHRPFALYGKSKKKKNQVIKTQLCLYLTVPIGKSSRSLFFFSQTEFVSVKHFSAPLIPFYLFYPVMNTWLGVVGQVWESRWSCCLIHSRMLQGCVID